MIFVGVNENSTTFLYTLVWENIFFRRGSFLYNQTDPEFFNYSFVRHFTDCLIHAITIEENIAAKEIKKCVKNNIKVKRHFINMAKLCLEQL